MEVPLVTAGPLAEPSKMKTEEKGEGNSDLVYYYVPHRAEGGPSLPAVDATTGTGPLVESAVFIQRWAGLSLSGDYHQSPLGTVLLSPPIYQPIPYRCLAPVFCFVQNTYLLASQQHRWRTRNSDHYSLT